MKTRLLLSLRGRWPLVLTGLLAVAVGSVATVVITLLPSEPATSEEGSPVARFDISPIPFPGYPATIQGPNFENPPGCTAPEDERPAPGLPTLPCHDSGIEPPEGTMATPAAGERRDPEQVPAGWQVVDNPMFRFTVAAPPDWYVNMRPEGGEFYLLDPVAFEEDVQGTNPPGGVMMHFGAQVYEPVDESRLPPEFVPVIQKHLAAPNATFGGYPGAIWEPPPEEGLARNIQVAFVREGVVFTVLANIEDDRPMAQVDADAATVQEVLASITPC